MFTRTQVHDLNASSLLRRLLAIIYDLMLLFSVLFMATIIVLPLTDGEAIASDNYLYTLYLLICSYLFFSWQWVHGGQTLGMRAWNIAVIQGNGQPLNWKLALLRFILALLSWLTLGAGFLWALFDREKMTFYDRFSNTRVVNKRIRTSPTAQSSSPERQ